MRWAPCSSLRVVANPVLISRTANPSPSAPAAPDRSPRARRGRRGEGPFGGGPQQCAAGWRVVERKAESAMADELSVFQVVAFVEQHGHGFLGDYVGM